MPVPGPWVQPPDGTGSFSRSLSWQGWSTTFADGAAYPAYPGTAVASAHDADSIVDLNGWFLHFEDLIPDANGFPDTWVWTLREGFLGVDVQWWIDNHPDTLMPPVPPASLPPKAIGYEYETTHGAPTGPVDITASALFFDDIPTISDPTGDPAFPPAGDWQASTFRVRRVPSTAYTWNHTSGAVTPTSWLPGSVSTSYPLVADVGFDGTGHGELDLAVSTNIASLDAGAYTVLIVSSLIETEATPPPPHNTDPLGHKVRVSAQARQTLTGDASLTASVHYRPPRYRFLYDQLPRLRQFPRDDALGGSPRQGKANGPTSVQASTRQGWRGTYR